MVGGYTGKILEVNLSTGKTSTIKLEEEGILRKFIGGSGLAAKIFFERVPPNVDPLSPDNILCVMTGPLAGTRFPGSARFEVCCKSPLTNIWAESSCGGAFGPELKFAGFDGIIIEGASDKPVYLFIDNGEVEIRDASDLWGKDTYEVCDELKKKLKGDREVKVLTIGQAGENLVKYAAIIAEKRNAAGRCGIGAVMGSKKLKAIAVRGTGKVELALPDEFSQLRESAVEKMSSRAITSALRSLGTDSCMSLGMVMGDVPSKNWSLGENSKCADAIDGTTLKEKFLTKVHACPGCPIACKRVVEVKSGPYKGEEQAGPEYETCASFGTLIMNDDLAAIIKINEICNRYGLDTISCGCTIAFAMDCFEHGLISEEDTDGVKLTWGNMEDVFKIVDKIAKREGFGDVLAEGSKGAAKRIGKNAPDFAVEVKGLEAPMHDPRAYHAQGLGYATSNRGACHLQCLSYPVEQSMANYPEIGLVPSTGQTSENKAKLTYVSQNLAMVFASSVMCQFAMWTLELRHLVDALRTTTGFEYTLEEILECGERIWLLERGLNNLMGVRASDDRLPRKILTPTKEGGAAGSVLDIRFMLKEFYELRSLDADGIPKKERLESLGLLDLVERLYQELV